VSEFLPLRPIPEDPKPGDFGLSVITGITGMAVRLAQAVIGDTTRYTHAWLVIDSDGFLIEAQPGGARLSHLDFYRGRDVYYHRADYLTEEQRIAVGEIGRGFLGVPYSYADYLALGLGHFGKQPKWLKRHIATSGKMICSQLIDEAYRRAGYHMFNDGRTPQDVTPGDLFWEALRKDLTLHADT
jgi:hypothetical protein